MSTTVWGDEDGNYWGDGHIEPTKFIELCREHDAECGIDSAEEGVDDGGLNPLRIRHSWFRQHPEDEDLMFGVSPATLTPKD